jgi:hypothetical protein
VGIVAIEGLEGDGVLKGIWSVEVGGLKGIRSVEGIGEFAWRQTEQGEEMMRTV